MKYMLMILDDVRAHAGKPAAEMKRIVAEHAAFAGELASQGKLLAGERLAPGTEAATVRMKTGKRVVVDGPFAETKEVLGGFYIVECASMDEALALARRCPIFESDAVEVRPVWGTG